MENKDEFIMIAAGLTHNAAINSNGEIYTWGD